MNNVEIGRKLVERRRILGVDQKSIAELSGVSVHTLSNIESGKGNPSLKILCKILDVLGLELSMDIKKI
ncbi:MAG: helix-turn-helix domain-containing protein [Spartobacteria bacterium]|nr:helix-turn-helix domain-containing protein [Spartobacteria bacterium]